jgi:dienelactone hydrolase
MEYPVITLCGSTKFKDEFARVNRELTLQGYIIISVACYGHAGDDFDDSQKEMLDDIHKRKIDMADGIFVINVDNYIGKSTQSEIDYAKEHGKFVKYLIDPVTLRQNI